MVQISIIIERNLRNGFILFSLIAFGSYIIIDLTIGSFFAGFFLFSDVEFVLGTVFGVIYATHNRQEHQSYLKIGALTGAIGGIISSVLIGLYEFIFIAIIFGPDMGIFFFFLGISLISGIVIGLIGGALIATYYNYKELKGETKEDDSLKDDFFDDLIKK
ncbi:MAG: hypothetical protein ACW98X_10205 [Promethearchaeota archaeon]